MPGTLAPAPQTTTAPDGDTAVGPDLGSYDTIIVAFSGGKDSIACLLSLIEAGVPRERIELCHHDVDGQGPPFMDWPSTTAYCRAVARELDVPLYLSWKAGGFLREMSRTMRRPRRSISRHLRARSAPSAVWSAWDAPAVPPGLGEPESVLVFHLSEDRRDGGAGARAGSLPGGAAR